MESKVHENLGQVWTSDLVATLMMNIIKGELGTSGTILDPCVGPNTFFKNGKDLTNYETTGLDVDLSYVDLNEQSKYNIQQKNFFDLPLSQRYNAIIMNPPYVRQEDLVDSELNNKLSIQNILRPHFGNLNGKCNLYIYFILKGLLHLKQNGILTAIIYDSWLYSQYGQEFRANLSNHGTISHLIHFTNEAFEKAEVGATVIVFRKNVKLKTIKVKEISTPAELVNGDTYREISWDDFVQNGLRKQSIIYYDSKIFNTLQNLSERKVRRGTNTIASSGLVLTDTSLKDVLPIVKSISKQIKFEIQETSESIIYNDTGKLDSETIYYLEKIAKAYINEGGKKALVNRILTAKDWYVIKPKEPGNFLFNYYIRRSAQFLYNPKQFIASENFYQLYFSKFEFEYLAILNSILTKLAVIEKSRKQGKGLSKCQMYEFQQIKILDPYEMPKTLRDKLSAAGKFLAKLERDERKSVEILDMVDNSLIKYYNKQTNQSISKKDIIEELKKRN